MNVYQENIIKIKSKPKQGSNITQSPATYAKQVIDSIATKRFQLQEFILTAAILPISI